MSKNNLQPNKAAILEHLNFLFADPGDHKDGKIEIAYTPAHSGAVNKAEWFDVSDIEAAAECAARLNMAAGVNVYVGAAIRSPDTAPFGRSDLNDFYASTTLWADLDSGSAAITAKDKYKALQPSLIVVTGRHPHLRAQAWWKLMHESSDADLLKDNLAFARAALDGDPAVVDPARVMRLGGTVAWPKKEGRIPELTEIKYPEAPTKFVMLEGFKSYFPGVPASPLLTQGASGGVDKPRNPFTGHLVIDKLLEATRVEGQWHINMRDAIAAMVGQRWPDSAIRIAVQPYLRDNSLIVDMITPLIETARRKFEKPDPAALVGFDPVTGEILEKNQGSKGSTHKGERDQPFEEAEKADNSGQKTEEPHEKRLQLIYADDIKLDLTARDFVQGILGVGALSVVYGESNCGKTFFMTDLALHVAQGLKWRDRRVNQGGVIYAALEGLRGVQDRITAYKKHNCILGGTIPLAIMPSQLDFFSENANIAEFIELVKESEKRIGNVSLIVIDTLARAMAGGDENSTQDMSKMIAYADLIRRHTNAHLCFVHHSGKNKALGARGSGALRAGVDTEIEIGRPDGANYSTINYVKQRDLSAADEMYFGLKVIELGQNQYDEPITSCVVEIRDDVNNLFDKPKLTPHEKFIYDAIVLALIDHGVEKRPYKDGPLLKVITPEILADQLMSMGYKKLYNKDGETTVTTATYTRRIAMRDKGYIGFNNNYVWLLSDEKNEKEND